MVYALIATALIVLACIAAVLVGAHPPGTTHLGENLHPPSSETVLAGMRGHTTSSPATNPTPRLQFSAHIDAYPGRP
jgi:hypothetical protein